MTAGSPVTRSIKARNFFPSARRTGLPTLSRKSSTLTLVALVLISAISPPSHAVLDKRTEREHHWDSTRLRSHFATASFNLCPEGEKPWLTSLPSCSSP